MMGSNSTFFVFTCIWLSCFSNCIFYSFLFEFLLFSCCGLLILQSSSLFSGWLAALWQSGFVLHRPSLALGAWPSVRLSPQIAIHFPFTTPRPISVVLIAEDIFVSISSPPSFHHCVFVTASPSFFLCLRCFVTFSSSQFSLLFLLHSSFVTTFSFPFLHQPSFVTFFSSPALVAISWSQFFHCCSFLDNFCCSSIAAIFLSKTFGRWYFSPSFRHHFIVAAFSSPFLHLCLFMAVSSLLSFRWHLSVAVFQWPFMFCHHFLVNSSWWFRCTRSFVSF